MHNNAHFVGVHSFRPLTERDILPLFRLAQFYKDVELAEVMTDNSPKVGQILQLYQIEGENWAEDEEGEEVEQHDEDHEHEEGLLEVAGNSPRENENPNAGSRKRKQPAKSGNKKNSRAKKSKK